MSRSPQHSAWHRNMRGKQLQSKRRLLFSPSALQQLWLTIIVAAVILPLPVSAVIKIVDEGGEVGLPSGDFQRTVLPAIIRWALGLVALAAVVMIIYGGLIWLTAAGVEERITKAKKILEVAIVGLIIIILAFAIVSFIAGSVKNTTT